MKRIETRVVRIGKVDIGGANPIRIQSMTDTDTLDVEKTVNQVIRLQDSGCEIVRIAVPGIKHAYACEKIKNTLLKKGCDIPLVADIHFYPKAAITVCDFVEKVRINPGNFIKDEANFNLEMEEMFLPLINKCKNQKKPLRIGVNHGSLSQRILQLYGNTPIGMVESAVEYTNFCRKHDFHDIVFSMKASNPLIMIQAYRLLVEKMVENGWDYPLHLGVTEAGEGEDGIIKSSVGIGSLLLEGIGDTIRVSLTEKPENEIPIAKNLIKFSYSELGARSSIKQPSLINPLDKIESSYCWAFLDDPKGEKGWKGSTNSIDGLLHEEKIIELSSEAKALFKSFDSKNSHKLSQICFLKDFDCSAIDEINPDIIFFSPVIDRINKTRKLYSYLKNKKKKVLLFAYFSYEGDKEYIKVSTSSEMGKLLFDNLVDGICLKANLALSEKESLTLSILQSCRKKITKPEYISCPGCGRTLYDIQKVTKNIKVKTSHLVGIKIAVMGCIVNGIGEMADADFGIVGSGKDRVDLYLGKKCVDKDIDFSIAEERLINLIKKEGKWKDKSLSLT